MHRCIIWRPCQGYHKGWPSFWLSLAFVGVLVALISDCARHLGCFTQIKESVVAITFLALGTSIPGGVSPWHAHNCVGRCFLLSQIYWLCPQLG